ncbi:MAG: CoxG family protein [Rhodospirillales bacterium]
MDMTGEYRIAAPREQVWKALNDPEILKLCIPGCETVEKTSDTEFTARVTAAIGPVKAKFAGKVRLSDLDPPYGYTINGEGQGGAAGFAKGGAKVSLSQDGDGTLLSYNVNASVGGKLAQVGSRLIDGVARKMADEFFGRFAATVEGPKPAPVEQAAEAAAPVGKQAKAATPKAAPAPASAGLPGWVWIAGVIAAVAVVLAIVGLL